MQKILFFLMAMTSLSFGANSITIGQTWGFAEKNALDEIQEHIKNNKTMIQMNIDKNVSSAKEKALSYKAPSLTKLPRATNDESYIADMTYALEFDIKDQTGAIIYPKGYKYTITDYLTLPYKIIVIDITDKLQLEWYKKSKYAKAIDAQVMTVDGTISELKQYIPDRPVYYFNNKMIDRFQVKKVPSIIEQKGKTIKVTTIALSEQRERQRGKEE